MTVATPYGPRTITEKEIRDYIAWRNCTRQKAINALQLKRTFEAATEARKRGGTKNAF